MEISEQLASTLPDADAAKRFADEFAARHPAQAQRLARDPALFSDVLTVASFSPLLATTLLQNPEYLWWLQKRRKDSGVRSTEELLESHARFSLTCSQLEPQVVFARFRRRELLRIFLRDIRGLATVPEITEEISNLADAILSSALKRAATEMDNRFGRPQTPDAKGRSSEVTCCIVALGKLGSRELNYSSDIDLIFLYSDEGETSGSGSRGKITNREYFVKLAEYLIRLIGSESGEGAAYRVDLRLRPHGRLGPLAQTVADTVRYYRTEARDWERQVMIRSRASAGDPELFRKTFASIQDVVFSKNVSPAAALANVRISKELIDKEQPTGGGFNVKLGRGGISEIEFLAQALQLAHGGKDAWLRFPHTLVILARLAERHFLAEAEMTGLADAYEFLRRTEHILQMENGLQTHTIPEDPARRKLVTRRVEFTSGGKFEKDLKRHTELVAHVFKRIFGEIALEQEIGDTKPRSLCADDRAKAHVLASIAKSSATFDVSADANAVLERVTEVSPHFAEMLAASPQLVAELTIPDTVPDRDYRSEMLAAVKNCTTFGERLAAMRRAWSRALIEIVVADVFDRLPLPDAKRLQTQLAEASIAAALWTVREELTAKYRTPMLKTVAAASSEIFPGLAVLALGKLGGKGVDYDSDLDVLVVYDSSRSANDVRSDAQGYWRAVELFVTCLSSMTRDGSLYRVDLRLRPYGSKGLSAMPAEAFLEYMRDVATPWEFLAFVKLRAVGGDLELGDNTESETRGIIHERASQIPAAELAEETRRVRAALEDARTSRLRSAEVDIKYGAGGILDIYFATRFLQLRDNIPDGESDRSTTAMIETLHKRGSLPDDVAADLRAGYDFLAALDHNIRLTVGRSTRLPAGNHAAMTTIASRMSLSSPSDLLEQLTLHRLSVHDAFQNVTS
jgi:glutamate-ammonia-ligase adenylyltransferase